MQGLTFKVEGTYFNCFRKPESTSTILTYPIPPFTTIRGLVANSMGLKQFPYYDREKYLALQGLRIGIRPLRPGEKSVELSKILKLISREEKPCFKRTFPSAPMFREFLVNPNYRIYIFGNGGLVEEISEKIENPERPFYLGQSDDMIDIEDVKLVEGTETRNREISSVVKGVHERCEVVRLPFKFSSDGTVLEEMTVSIPKEFPYRLEEETDCLLCDNEFVCAY